MNRVACRLDAPKSAPLRHTRARRIRNDAATRNWRADISIAKLTLVGTGDNPEVTVRCIELHLAAVKGGEQDVVADHMSGERRTSAAAFSVYRMESGVIKINCTFASVRLRDGIDSNFCRHGKSRYCKMSEGETIRENFSG